MSGGVDCHIYFYNLENFSQLKVVKADKLHPVFDPRESKSNFHSILSKRRSTSPEHALENEPNLQQCHIGTITDILVIASRDVFFTASMDSKIICWDLKIHAFTRQFLGHTKGVLSLAWTNDLLLSAGLDRDVLVWNP